MAASFSLGATSCLAEDASEMNRVVNGFYGIYSTFHPSDGIPDAAARAKYEPFISPSLDKLLIDGNRAEAAFAKANKNSPPLVEGDLFTSNFEGATSYKIGACTGDAKVAKCTIALTYNSGPKEKPIIWNDTVFLVATPSGWRVDDIGFGASWDFANRGKLSDTVRSVIADAAN